MSAPLFMRGAPSAPSAAWPLFAACFGCGGSEAAVIDPSPAAAQSYEGPAFYEVEAEPGAGARPTLEPNPTPAVPGDAPGFFEFVSGEEMTAACVGGSRVEPTTDAADLLCPPVMQETITDFDFTGSSSGVVFGPESGLRGGTYFYPDSPDALTSDVTGGDWHLTGSVSNVSGYGLYLDGCSQLDASSFRGIAFTLWGSLGEGGRLVFFVETASNQVSHAWINAHKASPEAPDEPPNLGRCAPLGGRYDGSCREARITLGVSETPRQVQVSWRDLTDGCPATSVDPAEITSIAWFFAPSPSGPYAVDLHIDDLRFTNEGPL